MSMSYTVCHTVCTQYRPQFAPEGWCCWTNCKESVFGGTERATRKESGRVKESGSCVCCSATRHASSMLQGESGGGAR